MENRHFGVLESVNTRKRFFFNVKNKVNRLWSFLLLFLALVTQVIAQPITSEMFERIEVDVPKSITLNGESTSGGALSFELLKQPSQGSLSGDLPNITYIPSPGYLGQDIFSYRVVENGIYSDETLVKVSILAKNQRLAVNVYKDQHGLEWQSYSNGTKSVRFASGITPSVALRGIVDEDTARDSYFAEMAHRNRLAITSYNPSLPFNANDKAVIADISGHAELRYAGHFMRGLSRLGRQASRYAYLDSDNVLAVLADHSFMNNSMTFGQVMNGVDYLPGDSGMIAYAKHVAHYYSSTYNNYSQGYDRRILHIDAAQTGFYHGGFPCTNVINPPNNGNTHNDVGTREIFSIWFEEVLALRVPENIPTDGSPYSLIDFDPKEKGGEVFFMMDFDTSQSDNRTYHNKIVVGMHDDNNEFHGYTDFYDTFGDIRTYGVTSKFTNSLGGNNCYKMWMPGPKTAALYVSNSESMNAEILLNDGVSISNPGAPTPVSISLPKLAVFADGQALTTNSEINLESPVNNSKFSVIEISNEDYATANLDISSIELTGDAAFELLPNSLTSLARGTFGALQVRFTPSEEAASYSAQLVFNSNDPELETFRIDINGLGLAPYISPEIEVSALNQPILNGDFTPSTINGTDFGTVSESVNLTCTITNTADVDLILNGTPSITSIEGSAFSILSGPSEMILSQNESTTFVVRFNPLVSGDYLADVNIISNDGDEGSFSFRLRGNALIYQNPLSAPDLYTIEPHNTLSVVAPGILSQDTDPDGGLLEVNLLKDVAHGTLNLNDDGSFTYTPDLAYSGVDSFTYQASNGVLSSAETLVRILVNEKDDDLVGHWSLDESHGNIAFDLSGNDFHGNVELASWGEGKQGGALDCSTPNYVSCGILEKLKISRDLTIAAWIKPSSYKNWGGIAGWLHDSGSTESGYVLNTSSTGGITFGLKTTNGAMTYINSKNNSIDEWIHVAGTYDGASMKLYVNGVLASSIEKTGDIAWDPLGNDGFEIGRYHDDNEDVRFDGLIDDVRVYKVALDNFGINKLQKEPFVVEFDLAGGTYIGGGYLSQLVSHASAASEPEFEPPAGYIFDQWSSSFDNITSNLLVVAQYSLEPVESYEVTFDLAGGSYTGGGALTQIVEGGAAAIAPEFTAPETYQFDSWSSTFDNITGDLLVLVQYVSLINSAPVLVDKNYVLEPTAVNDVNSSGSTVSSILSNGISDLDGDAVGIMLTDLDLSNGEWQYQLESTSQWQAVELGEDLGNVALFGDASQSSTGWSGIASKANDGNTDTVWSGGSVSHTSAMSNPWWEVKLDRIYPLDQILIFNRNEVSHRLHDLTISIFSGINEVKSIDIDGVIGSNLAIDSELSGILGDRVRITIRSKPSEVDYLSLAEVQIFAARESNLLLGVNDSLRFVSKPGFNGDASFEFRARELRSGVNGSLISPPENFGGTSAFSEVLGFASVTISELATNEAPVLLDLNYSLTSIVANDITNSGNTIASIINNGISDSNGDPTGIILTALNETNGSWEYKLKDSNQWQPIELENFSSNVAVYGEASQSSTGWSGIASRANDGNSNPSWSAGSVSHTGSMSNPWWEVKLDRHYPIDQIILYNRDQVQNRLHDLRVSVFSGSTEVKSVDVDGVIGNSLSLSKTELGLVVGDRVRVSVRSASGTDDYLSLAEVEVISSGAGSLLLGLDDYIRFVPNSDYFGLSSFNFRARELSSGANGTMIVTPTGYGGNTAFSASESSAHLITGLNVELSNVAPLGVASQSSTGWSGVASRANDGNTNPSWTGGSVTHTGAMSNPWWEVKLNQSYSIDQIILYNRDQVQERLHDLKISIYLGDKEVKVLDIDGPIGNSLILRDIELGSVIGDRVRVTIRSQMDADDYLSLAEVQIFSAIEVANLLGSQEINNARTSSETVTLTEQPDSNDKEPMNSTENTSESQKTISHSTPNSDEVLLLYSVMYYVLIDDELEIPLEFTSLVESVEFDGDIIFASPVLIDDLELLEAWIAEELEIDHELVRVLVP